MSNQTGHPKKGQIYVEQIWPASIILLIHIISLTIYHFFTYIHVLSSIKMYSNVKLLFKFLKIAYWSHYYIQLCMLYKMIFQSCATCKLVCCTLWRVDIYLTIMYLLDTQPSPSRILCLRASGMLRKASLVGMKSVNCPGSRRVCIIPWSRITEKIK